MALSEERMAKLCEAMPHLEWLFFGYPHMRASASDADPPRELKLHDDYNVHAEDFALMVSYVVGYGKDDVESLVMSNPGKVPYLGKTVTSLGGCDELEMKINAAQKKKADEKHRKELEGLRGNAIKPASDVAELFEWRTIGPMHIPNGFNLQETTTRMEKDGFEFASYGQPAQGQHMYFYRRKWHCNRAPNAAGLESRPPIPRCVDALAGPRSAPCTTHLRCFLCVHSA